MFSLTTLLDVVQIEEFFTGVVNGRSTTCLGVMLPCHSFEVMHITFRRLRLDYTVKNFDGGTLLGFSDAVLSNLNCKKGDGLTWTLDNLTLNFEKA